MKITKGVPGLPEGLDEYVHASGLPFVRVPGGELELGMSLAELEEARERLGPVARVDEWERVFDAAQPVRRARIAPFACALHPVPDALAPAPMRGRLRAIGTHEMFPDIEAWDHGYAAPHAESAAELRLLELEDPDAAALYREELEVAGALVGAEPVIVAAAAGVADVVARFEGARLLTSDEWEYVARAGGRRAWIDDPEVLSAHPFGIRGLHFGTWLADGSARGGAWATTPIQDRDEAIALHAAYRPPSGGLGFGVLLAQ